jgi:isopenicillin N synthase-like dioxygenase
MAEGAVSLAGGSSIPAIDFAGFTGGDAAERAAIAPDIRGAFEQFGFLYLRNHGVPQPVVDDLFAQARAFFDQPAEVKARARGPDARGYSGPGYSALDPTRPADLKEAFRAGYDSEPPRTCWPEGLPAFRETVLAFHDAASAACRRVMHALALSFGLPQSYFDATHQPHSGSTQLLHYPPLPGELLPGQLRSGAHTDWGTITLLFHAGDAGGLEIQRPDGTWLPAPSVPGAAIVNAADLLRRWTNTQLRSVLHRVTPPEGPAAARSRYSAVLFYQPRFDAVITCLEPCHGPGRPARYPPITAGEYLQARLLETRREGS